MHELNYFDIVVIVLVLLLGFKGFINGFVKEFFGLLGIIGGVFLASRVSLDMGNAINEIFKFTQSSSTINLIGFIATIIIFWIALYFIGIILSKILKLSGLGIFDRIFGFIAGGGKIFLIISIIIFALSNVAIIKKSLPKVITSSIMYPILVASGELIIQLDPIDATQGVVEVVDESIQKSAKKIIDDSILEIKNMKGIN